MEEGILAIQSGFDTIVSLLEGLTKTATQQSVAFHNLGKIITGKASPESESPETIKSNPDPNQVKLNVGGTEFLTTRQTLTKDADSYFATLFAASSQNEQQEFFIDRSPESFNTVLQFLRNDENAVGAHSLTDEQWHALQREADFYNLTGLQNRLLTCHPMLVWEEIPDNPCFQFSNYGATVEVVNPAQTMFPKHQRLPLRIPTNPNRMPSKYRLIIQQQDRDVFDMAFGYPFLDGPHIIKKKWEADKCKFIINGMLILDCSLDTATKELVVLPVGAPAKADPSVILSFRSPPKPFAEKHPFNIPVPFISGNNEGKFTVMAM
eukprot:TRINITY_DN62021_c0_g1_i1.p1 TRINITY_DN62021_c0_g1~~TRINITY_DN62021_c0_g1_i1.p1  ORF type:complete len:322 (+),score=45.73 TRINITY_DN62021_c0_g1_i1:38-1003(+)